LSLLKNRFLLKFSYLLRMSKEIREHIDAIKNFKKDIFCQTCGMKNSFPTGSERCSNCGYKQIDTENYDEHTYEISGEFFNNFINKQAESKIEYKIKKENNQYVLWIDDFVIKTDLERGSGTVLFEKITKFADKNNLEIKLRASDFYGSDTNRLIKFYKKFNFEETNDVNRMGMLMYRLPN